MGRPTKLTPKVQEDIVTAIRAGNYAEIAAKYAGIDESTYYRWMSQGEGEDAPAPYKEFRKAVENAKAASEIRNVALIQQAANNGTWQAAAWYLERTAYSRWGRHNKVEVTGAGGGAVQFDFSIEELEAKVAKALKKD